MGGNQRAIHVALETLWRAALATILIAVGPATARAALSVEALAAPAVSGVGPYYQDLEEAIKAFNGGDYATAFGRLENARKSTPRLAPPEIMMARLYFDAGMAAPGVAMLEKVSRSTPDDPEALILLAETAMAGGRFTEAGMLFAKAGPIVEAYRSNTRRREDLQVRLFNGMSIVAERDGDFAAAQKALAGLLAADPKNPAALQRLGRVLFRLDKGREAYEQFKLAAAADPKAPPAELAMAELFNDKENAEKWIGYALERSGNDVRTQLAVGKFRLRANDLARAREHSAKALELDPNGLDPNALAGMLARMETNYEAAVKHLGAAHLLAPADPLIINHLALSLIELPDAASHQRALQFAQLNLRQNPTNSEQLATFGWISYRLKHLAEAERALNTAYKAQLAEYENKYTSDMGYYLGALAADTGKYSQAVTLLRNALDSNTPFAYRKPAQQLLEKAQKLAAQEAAAPAGTATTAAPAASP